MVAVTGTHVGEGATDERVTGERGTDERATDERVTGERGTDERGTEEARATLERVRERHDEFVDFLSTLCRVESPTDHPRTQANVHAILGPVFEDLGYDVRIVPGRVSGDHLLAVPERRTRGAPSQLLIGHSDPVWPLRTLERMPVRLAGCTVPARST